jgi:hypothetical protein
MVKEFIVEDLGPFLKNFFRFSWKYLSRFYYFIKEKAPALEKGMRFIANALAQAVFYIFKALYLIIFYLLKIVWYATIVFYVKFLGFFGAKAVSLFASPKSLKIKFNFRVKEFKLFMLWLAKPFIKYIPQTYEKKILPKGREVQEAMSPVIGFGDFKKLLREPNQLLLRRAMAGWMIFFLVISTLGVASLTPLFEWLFRDRTPAYAATFTGLVKVSGQTTTLSGSNWLTALAYSGDGVNGDAESGNFNPINPGGTTDGSAGGQAIGYLALAANATLATSQFIGFKPNASADLSGIMLSMENPTATSLSNPDILVELLEFPTASCTTSCTGYVTGTQGAYNYPDDTIVLRKTIWQFNQALSGENLTPGNFGHAMIDFRFDPAVGVLTTKHYGIRISNFGAGAPVFGTWAANAPYGNFPTVDGTLRTIGVTDIAGASAPTVNMPLVLTGNSSAAGLLTAMVAGNSAAGTGMPTVRRTENQHWTATYSSASSNWTLAGSVSGTQSRKLTTPATGGTAASWVNDGVPFTTLTANSTATTRLCVASITGFAANQTINLWDSNTTTVSLTVASVNEVDSNCSGGASIITTAATVIGFTTDKNASIAQATWKQRIVQGAITTLTANSTATTRVCVASIAGFTAAVGTSPSVAIWDNNSNVVVTRFISTVNGTDVNCGGGPSLILDAAFVTGYNTADNAQIAEISANMSVSTPADGAVMKWTTFNHTQNPAGTTTLLARTTSVLLFYAKMEALATSLVRYPFLSNRHIFFVAYGTGNTAAPADGDLIIVGNGKADPDTGDASALTNDLNWSSKQEHVVTIDRDWDAAMAYTGKSGDAINDGAGTRTNYSAYSQNGGWISAVVCPGSKLNVDTSANKHYRLTIPGKILVDSDASVAFGQSGAAIPASSLVDIYWDNVSPAVNTNLNADTAVSATLTVISTTGFNPGDTIIIDDNDSLPTTRIVAAVENATTLTVTANLVVGYTTGQSAFVAKGPATELPTGADRRAGIYTMTGAITATQQNARAGRTNLYVAGSDAFRTMKSDLAVDIDGNIDTGFLGNNSADAGNTWVDVKDNVVGNWQPLDNIAVAGATNQAVDNNFSSLRMGANDDGNQFPVWTGLATAGGRNSLPTPNMEVAEIGTIPLTDIYNNNGTSGFSGNYATTSAWTMFVDGANPTVEADDAIYFGDQGSNMIYSLELNMGVAMDASASLSWQFYNGAGWTSFTPRDAYKYQMRTGHSVPLSANTTINSYTVSVTSGNQANFGVDQVVMIDDNNSDPIYRRISVIAAGVITFTEPVPLGYTTDQTATISRLNGGQWKSFNPSNFLTENGATNNRRILSWTPNDLTGTPAKTTVNGVNAYWVRLKVDSVSSWTTSPTNQTTPMGMSGIERLSSGAITVSSGVQEAKIGAVTPGATYNPNEQYMLEYGNSPGWVEVQRMASTVNVLPSAPYIWHISDGTLNINETNQANIALHNSYGSLSDGDYTIKALVYMDNVEDGSNRKLGLTFRQSIDGNGYAALINKTNAVNTIGLYTTLAGVPTVIGSAFSKAFATSAWYCLKAQAVGTTLNAKFWATTDCDTDPTEGSWDTSQTNATYAGGRFGVYAGAGSAGVGNKVKFDNLSTDLGFSDNFNNTGSWRVTGESAGLIGTAYPSVPFTSSYLNFIIKHKGGWNGVVNPEIGDKIYIGSTAIRNSFGLDSSVPITTGVNTKYEVWDFEWNPTSGKYDVTGSATGAAGTATAGSTYTSPNSEISLRINSGTPTGPKFGARQLLLQDNMRRNTGSWTGQNGIGSAVMIAPAFTLTGSAVPTRYNIEAQSGTITTRQNGTIDFWFKPSYNGYPATSTHPYGMYLLDQANVAQIDTDRLFIRHINTSSSTPEGFLEVGLYAAAAQGTLLRQAFSATAGTWYHFRLAWDETANAKRAWLNGTAFTIGQGSAVGTRGINAGLIKLGNRYDFAAPFDGALDEFAIFDNSISTSATDWGNFTPPTSAWVGGETVGTGYATSTGINIFRASFDAAMNPQEGFVWADYAYGNPAMIFTNGADTGNDRIRVVTYPDRTRIWVDNTGEKYTPSARIKFGSGFLENGTAATLAGWSNNFTFHHKAKRDSTSAPYNSPVLNLKRSIHMWSDEEINATGATVATPIHMGNAFGTVAVGLSGLANLNVSHLSTENQYSNFSIMNNPYTSTLVKPTQTVSKSVFYNYYDRAYTVSAKTQGTNTVGAYFVTTNFGATTLGTGYNATASQNVGIDGSIFMGCRNTNAALTSANGAASFVSGRLYTIANSQFYNNGVTGITSGAVNLNSGVAKMTIANNIFSVNNFGIRLNGNSFLTMSDNVFDGSVSDTVTLNQAGYGAGISVAQTTANVGIMDSGSIFGRGSWNEADISIPANTTTFEAESLMQFTGSNTQLLSPVLFGMADYNNMSRIPEHFYGLTIPGADIRGNYSSSTKDIVNFTTFGNMRTSGLGLNDSTAHTASGYAWRLDSLNPDAPLEYTAKVIGVANQPLAITGYMNINSYYGSTNLPTVTLSGLGMTGANLTWTAQDTANDWQQFVVSGTPTESAIADIKFSVQSAFVAADSGTSEIIDDSLGNYLPIIVEDVDKSWTTNQWVGYKFKDANGKIFDIVKNTAQLLYLKGSGVVPHLLSTTLTNATMGDYIIFRQPSVYIDDMAVLSGTVDTGTLDFHSSGQPVVPWLSTGLTATSIWGAQVGSFADIDGSFGQLLNDRLAIKRGLVNDVAASATVFVTDMTQATSNFYQNQMVVMMSGQNAGIARRISSYNGATKAITVDAAMPYAPAFNDEFIILSYYSSATGGGGATAQEIWEYNVRRLTDATLNSGSLATLADIQALNNISAADVWSAGGRSLSGGVTLSDPAQVWNIASALLSTGGSIGKLIVDNLNATISSRGTSNLTASDVWSEGTRTITSIENDGLAALALEIWTYETRTLTSGDLTAQRVWDTLLTSITTINSIGSLLKTNIDTTISSRASSAEVTAVANSLSNLINNLLVAQKAVDDPSPSTTEFITTLTNANDDFYNDGVLVFTSGSNAGQVRRISNYVGATKKLTITPALSVAPSSSDTFTILASTANASLDAAAIWAYDGRYLSGAALDSGSLATLSNIQSTESTLSGQLNTLINNLIVEQKVVNDAGASDNQFITTLTSNSNDFYNNGVLVFTSGVNAGQARRITDYVGASKQVTVSPALSLAPVNADTFTILAQTANSAVDAAAIWTYGDRYLSGATLDSGSLATLSDIQDTETVLASAISVNSTKLDKIINALIVSETSVNDLAPSTTVFATALTNATNDFYKNNILLFTSGLNIGQARRIMGYNGTTKAITVDPALALAPANADTFTILAQTSNTATLDAASIWAYSGRYLSGADLDSGSLATLSDLQSTETTLGNSIDAVSNSVDLLSNDLIAIRSAVSTAEVSPTISLFGTNLTSAVNDLYAHALLTFTSGQNSGVARRIDDYNGTTKAITVEPDLPFAPASSDAFTILKTLAVPVTKISTIQSDVAGIKDDVTLIKADIALIKTQLDNIEASIATLETSIDNIEVGSGSSTTNNTNVYNVKPEEMFTAMGTISNSIQNINTKLGRLDSDTLSSILSISQENMTDIKYVRNKLADYKAVTTVQRQVVQQATAPIVSTWYTSGSVDLNIMLSNPAKTAQKVPFKIYLPKEAKVEHIMDDGGFNIQYDVQLDTLYAAGEIELAPGASVKKFIKMRDIWQIAENDLTIAKTQANDFYKKLEKNQLSSQALLLKNDIDSKVEKILRTQKENTASPQDKIMTYRENKESFISVQTELDELKSLLSQADASRGFLGALGGIQTISVWGIIIAFVTGFGLLVTILFSMWKHQVAIANGQMALQSHILTGKPLDMEKMNSSGGRRKKKKAAVSKNSPANIASVEAKAKVSTSFLIYIKQFFTRLFKNIRQNKVWLITFVLIFIVLYLLVDKYGILANIRQNLSKYIKTDELRSANNVTVASETDVNKLDNIPVLADNNMAFSFGSESASSTSSSTVPATEDILMKKQVIIKDTPTGWLNVRQEASKETAVVAKVSAGEKYDLLSQVAAQGLEKFGWYQIALTENKVGWVFAEYAEELK